MSVNEKLTAIADAIRSYTRNSEKLGLDDMVSGVADVYRTGLSIGGESGYKQGYNTGFSVGQNSKLFEVHKITVASDLSSGYNVLLSNNQFIKDHYQDDGFVVTITPLTPPASGVAGQICYCYSANRPYCYTNDEDVCQIRVITNATAVSFSRGTSKANEASYNGFLYVNSAGEVKMQNTASVVLNAGDYLIMLAVVEE